MASIIVTQSINTDQQSLWRILSDMSRCPEWMVLPQGRVTGATVIRDAGVLTGTARKLELEGGRWLEEEFYEAAAPNFVAYRVLRDSTGDFNRKYKEMAVSIRSIPAPDGGLNVTLSISYTKASRLGRWFDFFEPRRWRQALQTSLENLGKVAASGPPVEVFTPSWREEPAPEPEPKEPEVVEAIEETNPEDTEALHAELEKLRQMRTQMREMGLDTAELDARIAELER